MLIRTPPRAFRLVFVISIIFVPVFAAAQTSDLTAAAGRSKNPAKVNLRPRDEKAERQNRLAEEIARYRLRLETAPEDAHLRYRLGALYYDLQNYDEAARQLEKAAAGLQPDAALKADYAAALYNLSIVYDRLNRYPEALATVQKALAAGFDILEGKTQECQLLLLLTKNREAVSCYESFLGTVPPSATNRVNYGIALTRAKQHKKALAVLREAAALFPGEAKAHNALGLLLFKRKKYQAAAAEFTRAVETDAGFRTARFNLAIVHFMRQDRESALKQYKILKGSDAKLAFELYKFLYRDKILFVNPEPRGQ